MDHNNSKIKWACYRGMLELDLILIPFFENSYPKLSQINQQKFQELLKFSDPELYELLINGTSPEDESLWEIISKIRDYSKIGQI